MHAIVVSSKSLHLVAIPFLVRIAVYSPHDALDSPQGATGRGLYHAPLHREGIKVQDVAYQRTDESSLF